MRVLVDMDGVVADFAAGIDAAAERAGLAAELLDPGAFELEDRYGARGPELRRAINQPGFYAELAPITGAIDGLRRLEADGLEVWMCTAPVRSRWCAGEKIDWMATHLGRDWAGRTVVSKDKTLVRGDVLIDDKPQVTGVDVPSWNHLVFDQPYNRLSPGPRLLGSHDPELLPVIRAAAA